jgi:hypothetical protein
MLVKAKFKRPTPAPVPCETCRAVPVKLGGSCVGCRLRRCRGTIVDDASCAVPGCPVYHPRMLRWHRFTDDHVVLCANHSALAGRRPITWNGFRAEALTTPLTGWTKSA